MSEALDDAIEILWEIAGLGMHSNPRIIERGWREGVDRASTFFDDHPGLFEEWWNRNESRIRQSQQGGQA